MTSGYEDVIHTERKDIKIIPEGTWKKIFFNKEYYQIYNICDKPKIMDEIFNDLRKLHHVDKSDSTLYRYFKKLVDYGILMDVGNRIYQDSSYGKRLFSQASQFILFKTSLLNFWNSDRGDVIGEAIGFMINYHYGHKAPNIKKISQFFLNFEKEVNNHRLNVFRAIADASKDLNGLNEKNKVFLEKFKNLNSKEFYVFFVFSGIILNLINIISDKFGKKLENCYYSYKEKTEVEISKKKSKNVVTYSPVLIKPIQSQHWDQFFGKKDLLNFMILRSMRSGPKTVHDINIMQKQHIKQKKQFKEFVWLKLDKFEPRGKTTIYKHIQTLIKAGFVVEAGKRVIPKQSATQTLYGRVADLFYPIHFQIEFFQKTNSGKVIEVLGLLLCIMQEKETIDDYKFQELIKSFIQKSDKSFQNAMVYVKNPRIKEIFDSFESTEESRSFIFITNIIDWILTNDNLVNFQNQFNEIFK
jgi:predicted transcriptional regulator